VSGLHVRATIAARGIDIEFSVPAGEVLAVLGPNGAGKSTALHVVTGLVPPDSGLVRLDDRVLTDTGTGVNVATHDRRVGLLLQDPLLFPHLTVADNVAFAPRAQGRDKATARERALHWLREVGATDFADRKPRELSGGQAQRVAIARALAGEPDVLLLDEPMAGLDVAVAAAIRAVLRRVLARDGRSAMLVTHDLLDVVTLADHVLVLEDGRVAEAGRTADVLGAPRSGFGARLAGVNVVTGTVESDGVLRTPTGEFWHGIPAVPLTPGQPAVAVFPPAAVAVYAEPPKGSPRNVLEVILAEFDTRGTTIRLRAESPPGIAADITADAAADLWLAPGSRVWFAIKAQEVVLHGA
jgi:molybdate transport system ATP-binding protein